MNEDLKNFLYQLTDALKVSSSAPNYEIFSNVLADFAEDLYMKLDKMEKNE